MDSHIVKRFKIEPGYEQSTLSNGVANAHSFQTSNNKNGEICVEPVATSAKLTASDARIENNKAALRRDVADAINEVITM